MSGFEHPQKSWHADGEPSDNGIKEFPWLAVRIQEHIRPRRSWSGLTTVIGDELPRFRIEEEEKPASADTECWGFTKFSTICAAIAASMALPPARRTSRPAWDASG